MIFIKKFYDTFIDQWHPTWYQVWKTRAQPFIHQNSFRQIDQIQSKHTWIRCSIHMKCRNTKWSFICRKVPLNLKQKQNKYITYLFRLSFQIILIPGENNIHKKLFFPPNHMPIWANWSLFWPMGRNPQRSKDICFSLFWCYSSPTLTNTWYSTTCQQYPCCTARVTHLLNSLYSVAMVTLENILHQCF